MYCAINKLNLAIRYYKTDDGTTTFHRNDPKSMEFATIMYDQAHWSPVELSLKVDKQADFSSQTLIHRMQLQQLDAKGELPAPKKPNPEGKEPEYSNPSAAQQDRITKNAIMNAIEPLIKECRL